MTVITRITEMTGVAGMTRITCIAMVTLVTRMTRVGENDSMNGIHMMIGMTGIPVATRMARVTMMNLRY